MNGLKLAKAGTVTEGMNDDYDEIDGDKDDDLDDSKDLEDEEGSDERAMVTRKRKHHELIRQACKESISESAYPFGDNSTKKKQRENGLVDLTKKFIELLQTASN